MIKIFKYLLGSLMGGVVGGFIGVFFFMVMIVSMMQFKMFNKADGGREGAVLKDGSVLVLNLSSPVSELTEASIVSSSQKNNLHDLKEALLKASKDSKIKTLLVKGSSQIGMGWSTAKELRKAISDFSDSGKSVVAFSNVADEKALYIMSAAKEIYMHPQGEISWNGFAVTPVFYKGFFDKIQLQPIVFKAGKFKSAIEPFINRKMSAESRQQTSELIEDLWEEALDTISKSRSIAIEDLRAFADNISMQTAADAKKLGLVNKLIRKTDLIESLVKSSADSLGTKKDLKKLVSVSSYLNFKEQGFLSSMGGSSVFSQKISHKNKIAIFVLEGSIMMGATEENVIGALSVVSRLQKLRMDESIKGVILRVNSPGGSALASDIIWHEVEKLKKEKKVYVSMGDVAASGGYYISAGADKIFAEANTITGSIGVFSVLFNTADTMRNKLGFSFDRVVTSEHADIGSSVRKMKESEKVFFQDSVERVYQTFLGVVGKGRKYTKASDVEMVAQGRVWSGNQAKEVGLIDEIGGLEAASLAIAEDLELSEYELDYYPKRKAFGALFTKLSKYGVNLSKLGALFEEPAALIDFALPLPDSVREGDVMALTPYKYQIN